MRCSVQFHLESFEEVRDLGVLKRAMGYFFPERGHQSLFLDEMGIIHSDPRSRGTLHVLELNLDVSKNEVALSQMPSLVGKYSGKMSTPLPQDWKLVLSDEPSGTEMLMKCNEQGKLFIETLNQK